ncbi:MAG: CHAT domain-containing protein [Candidatus Tectimicrobiota bacterium]
MRLHWRGLLWSLILGLALGGQAPGSSQPLHDTLMHLKATILRLTGEGHYAAALAQAQTLLSLVHQAPGTSDFLVAQVLSATATLTWLQGDPQQGAVLYQQALHLLETTVGPDDRSVIPTLLSWGTLARDYGHLQQAQQLLTRALSLCSLSTPEHASDAITILVALATVLTELGHYQQAARELHTALQLVAPEAQQTDPRLIPVLHGLGRVSHALGAWSQAATWLHRALRLQATQAPEASAVAPLLIDLAAIHQDQQEYGPAADLLQRARTSLAQRWGDDAAALLPVLQGQARLALARGDEASAATLLLHSLASIERTAGPTHPNAAQTLFGLGAVWTAQADYARAAWAYRRALAIWEQTLGPEHPYRAYGLYNLALLAEYQGQGATAAPLYQQALHLWEQSLGAGHPLLASAMSHAGSLAEAQHDLPQAQQWFSRALHLWRQALGAEHPSVAIAASGLARVHTRRGELPQALAHLSQANDILERTLYRNLHSGSERQRHLYLTSQLKGNTHHTLAFHFQAAPHNLEAARLALRTVLRRKGLLLEAQVTTQQHLWRQLDAEGRKRLESLQQWRELRTRLALTAETPAGAADELDMPLEETLDELIEEHEQALLHHVTTSQGERQLPTLEAVAQQLPPGTLLVEFVTYIPLLSAPALEDQGLPPKRYGVYVLHGDGNLHWADLGTAQDIDQEVAALRSVLHSRQPHTWQAPSQALYQRLIQPLTPWLAEAQHLLLSPDGALHVLPFAALRDAQGTLLLERYQLTYLSTGRELLQQAAVAPAMGPPVIIAGPDFDALIPDSPAPEETLPRRSPPAAGPQRRGTLPTFSPLPGASQEGQMLQHALTQAVVLTGAEATEARLKAVRSPRLLHLATHGFFLPYQSPAPRAPTALLAAEPVAPRGFTVAAEAARPAVHGSAEANPLLRAGLALAGANHPQAEQEDGVLTAMEATALDLQGTQLVVLSACDTGLGDIRDGESVYGLRRAFTIAGAASQVSTLWQVSDSATQAFMTAYYQRLLAGEARSAALRQVQLASARSAQWSHPFYWAAFLFSGRWGPLFPGPSQEP